jgi:hypothetical protein
MNSVYSKELHVSIPTLDYLKKATGIDVMLEAGNKELAEGKVYSLTSRARDMLFVGKSTQTQRIISYLIFKGTWKEAWENYVLKYIEATLYYGDETVWKETPKMIHNAIFGSVLMTREFTYQIKSEVEHTAEVF